MITTNNDERIVYPELPYFHDMNSTSGVVSVILGSDEEVEWILHNNTVIGYTIRKKSKSYGKVWNSLDD